MKFKDIVLYGIIIVLGLNLLYQHITMQRLKLNIVKLSYDQKINEFIHDAIIRKVQKLQKETHKLQLNLRTTQSVLVSSIELDRPYIIRNVKITFYSNDPISINKAEYRDGLTALRIPVGEGVIAVDPKVIPYGSIVYIPRLRRFFIAVDTGSAVKGKHVDVYVSSRERALRLGVFYDDIIVCGKVDVYSVKELLERAKRYSTNL